MFYRTYKTSPRNRIVPKKNNEEVYYGNYSVAAPSFASKPSSSSLSGRTSNNKSMDKKLKKNELRAIGRAYALQALYQHELNPQSQEFNWENLDDESAPEPLSAEDQGVALDFAQRLFEGVVDRKGEIDQALNAAFDKGRTIERTAPVDRCILRLAAFEILFSDTPRVVAISQAIELGNKFGDVKTRAFLNGVLDHLGKESNASSKDAASSAEV